MLNLPQDFKDPLQILSVNNVQYMIVGGYALSLYAAPRTTGGKFLMLGKMRKKLILGIDFLKKICTVSLYIIGGEK